MLQNFIEKQRKILEEEHRVEKIEHEALITENTSQELQLQGYAINKLKLKSTKTGLYGRTLLTFAHPHYSKKATENPQLLKSLQLPESKFSNGDNIAIFKYDTYFDSQKALERGVIYKKTNFKIIVSFENDFEENRLQNEVISLVIETNEVTYKRCTKTLDQIQIKYNDTKFQGSNLLRVLIDGEDPSLLNPFIKQAHVLDQQKSIKQFFNQKLNSEQKEAINFCLQNQNISLIHGPPGTGKTSTVCELILQAVQLGMKVLACAGSNIAVDNIVERLQKQKNICNTIRIGHPARMIKEIYESCLDYKLRKTCSFQEIKELKQRLQKSLQDLSYEKQGQQKKAIKDQIYGLRQAIKDQEKVAIREILNETNVICCTNTGAADRLFNKEMKDVQFDLVVIDECAQSMELSCWIPLLKGKRAVFAGDHKQLQPTIKCKENEKEPTLFDRIHTQFPQTSRLLCIQYRMNNTIMQFSSQFVYQNKLQADDSVANHQICQEQESVLLLVDTAGAKMGENVCEKGSKYNVGEADLVYIIVEELMNLYKVKGKDIGVITPYNAQVEQIRKIFEKQNLEGIQDIEVSTVDGFQGREKECIIISMVRSNDIKQVGFLNDYRRMNVAVTRAKKFVCLIGDSLTVTNDPFLANLIKYFEEKGEVRSALEYKENSDVRFDVGGNIKEIIKEEKKKQKKKKKNDTKQQTEQLNPIQKQQEQQQQKKEKYQEEDLKEEYTEKLILFQNSNEQELIFIQLNSFQRKILHELCEKQNLEHISEDTTNNLKNLIVKKKTLKEIQQQDLEQKEETKNLQKVIQNIQKQQKEEQELNYIQQQKKPNKKPKQKPQNKQEEDTEEDILQFLENQKVKVDVCNYTLSSGKSCPQNAKCLGQTCQFCCLRFCMKHALAEEHGCGEQAKIQAQKEFRTQFMRNNFGEKPLSEQEKQKIKNNLDDKIQKMQQQRKPQQKKKK